MNWTTFYSAVFRVLLFLCIIYQTPRNLCDAREAEVSGVADQARLAEVIVPSLEIKDCSLRNALSLLQKEWSALHQGREGLSFIVMGSPTSVRVTLAVENIPFDELLATVARQADYEVLYETIGMFLKRSN